MFYHLRVLLIGILLVTIGNLPPASSLQSQALPPRVNVIGWNSSGQYLAVGYANGSAEILDTLTNQTVMTLDFSSEGFQLVRDLAWNPVNPSLLALGLVSFGDNQAVTYVYDMNQQSFVFTSNIMPAMNSIAWSSDGKHLAVAKTFLTNELRDRIVEIWDVSAQRLLLEISTGLDDVTSLAWSPSGQYLAGSTSAASILIWNPDSGEVIKTLLGHSAVVTDIAWSPDGRHLASSSGIRDSTIRIWDLNSGETILTIPNQHTTNISWSRAGSQLAVLDITKALRIFDPYTGIETASFPQAALQETIAFSPYGGRIAFAGMGLIGMSNSQPPPMLKDTVFLVVPNPSAELLLEIVQQCEGNGAVLSIQQAVEAQRFAEVIVQLGELPASTIPPACAADLIAVASALQSPP